MQRVQDQVGGFVVGVVVPWPNTKPASLKRLTAKRSRSRSSPQPTPASSHIEQTLEHALVDAAQRMCIRLSARAR